MDHTAVLEQAAETELLARQRIAVLVPCFNDEATIATVAADFMSVLPDATIYVYDNNSTDRTGAVARAAGAVVRREAHQGKGNVVRRMFSDIDAEIYVLVDGNATYDATSARAMIVRLVEQRLDMVIAARLNREDAAYRLGHRLLSGFVALVFGAVFTDMMSGYRVLSRRFVKSFPVLGDGYEIETELTLHALELEMPVAEVPTPYYARPGGSASEHNTGRDRFRILGSILKLYRSARPLSFFSGLGTSLAVVSIVFASPIFVTFLREGVVPRLPTAVLASGLMLAAFLCIASGLVLETVTRGRREMRLLAYLQQPAPGEDHHHRHRR
jgi:glycosyltransferase involved in cell wall biosynthesis